MSSGLNLSLTNALTGLKVNQRNLSVLSHNIANVNTEGYSRQLVQQHSQVIDGIGSGVRIDDVVRNIDKYLQRSIIAQQSGLAQAEVIDEFHDRLQILLGAPGSTNTLDEYVTTFFNAMQQLSETPERTSYRTNATSAAVQLANEISKLAYEIENLRYEADRELNQSVNAVNDVLRRLDTLNIAIERSYNLHQSTADLLDQRDMMLRDLASYMDISIFYEESGKVNVLTTSGVSLVDGTPHMLVYSPQLSVDNFIDNGTMSQLAVAVIGNNGQPQPNPQPLLTGGQSDQVTSTLTGGTLKGLHELRDIILPDMVEMMDMLVSQLRDEVNAIHNNGSAFPGRTSLTGTRVVSPSDQFSWTGSVRIGVLSANGEPYKSVYNDELYTGFRPLTLDLSFLDSGQGAGQPSMQTIVDEINNYFRAPPVKAKVGVLNNVQLVSTTDYIPNFGDSVFRFDLDIDNISGSDADVFVTGISVLNDVGTDITSVSTPAAQIALSVSNTYTTTTGSNNVFIEASTTPTVVPGDFIYLSPPAGAVNGLTPAQLTGYFRVVSVTGNSIEIEVVGPPAGGTGAVSDASGVYMNPPYDTINAGDKRRTRDSGGSMGVDLSGDMGSSYYDITLTVASVDETGALVESTITYRVQNNQNYLLNDRYDNIAVGGAGERVLPNSSQGPLRAIMVDANGNELPKINGRYIDTDVGYLKLVAVDGAYVSIDEMDSKHLGNQNTVPASGVTNRAFSHYFGLNNLFEDNLAYGQIESLDGAAINLKVEEAIARDPNLISTGKMVLQRQPSSPNDPPQWTYVRYNGDNQTSEAMAALATKGVNFGAAGGLPMSNLTIGGYVSEMLGYVAAEAASSTSALTNQQVLYNSLNDRAQSVSGVNLDEELAMTIIYQNAYSANARIVSIVNQLFDDLIGIMG